MAANYSASNEQNHRWFQYGWILAGILLATLVRFPVQPLIRDTSPFLFYFPVVVCIAIVFGRRFGLLATALSILPANYFWMPPDNAFEMNLSDAWHIFGFSCAGFSVSWLSGTARKRKQLEEHLRATLASVEDAIVTTDCCGSIVYLNTIARRLTEMHGDEAIGRAVGSTLELFAENGEISLNGTFQKALTGDDIESLPRRVIISSKSGKRYHVEQKTTRILDAKGRKLGLAILFHPLGFNNNELPAPAVIIKEGPPNAMPLKSPTLPQLDTADIGSCQSPAEADGIEADDFSKRGIRVTAPLHTGKRFVARKSGRIVPHCVRWHQYLGAGAIWVIVTGVSTTIRCRVNDPHGFMTRKDIRQVIYCTWHNRLALSMKLHSILEHRHFQTAGLAGLVSASRDGAFLSAILKRFGVQSVRGSTSRRGPQALRELVTMIQRGYDIAITPDGPRGPCYVVQDGVLALAQVTGLPVVPVSYHVGRKIQLKSWDRFQIPLPFSPCEITIGKVMHVPRKSSQVIRESLRREFEMEMLAITRDQ